MLVACGAPQPQVQTQQQTSAAPSAAAWSYAGDNGPARWASLDPKFAACTGARQSPIDLPATLAPSDAHRPAITYAPAPLVVLNTGHTIEVEVHPPTHGTLTFEGAAYSLAQFHFHVPSEHTVAGAHFDGELHFVHKLGDKIVVLGVFIKTGAENATLAPLFDAAPHEKGEHPTNATLDVQSLVPQKLRLARYEGSLTTPPCSETVTWLVEMPDAGVIEVSAAQLAKLRAALGDGPTNRPTQDIHGRSVAEVTAP